MVFEPDAEDRMRKEAVAGDPDRLIAHFLHGNEIEARVVYVDIIFFIAFVFFVIALSILSASIFLTISNILEK